MSDNFFDNLEGDFDDEKIAMEEMVRPLANLYKAFVTEGLKPQEAAAMVAAFIAQGMPMQSPPPQED